MTERPPRLPFSATFVVRGSRILSWGEKAVWLELWALDKGPEGAWISDCSLAAVLGLDEGTVKNYRFGLRRRQLAMTVPRPGTRQVGWVMRLPAAAVPGSREQKVWGARAVALALILDGHLRTIDGTAGGAMKAMPPVRPSQHRDGDHRNAEMALMATAMGGKGGSPTSASRCETTLQPQLRKEDGVGSYEPEAEVGEEGREPESGTVREHLRADLDRQVAEGKLPPKFADSLRRVAGL